MNTMTTKNRIVFTVTVEYFVHPENYHGCKTDAERLAVDLKNAEDDPFMFLSDDAKWEIVGEVVK